MPVLLLPYRRCPAGPGLCGFIGDALPDGLPPGPVAGPAIRVRRRCSPRRLATTSRGRARHPGSSAMLSPTACHHVAWPGPPSGFVGGALPDGLPPRRVAGLAIRVHRRRSPRRLATTSRGRARHPGSSAANSVLKERESRREKERSERAVRVVKGG